MGFPWAMGTEHLWSVEDGELTARRLDALREVVWRSALESGPSSPTAIAVHDDPLVVAIGFDDGRIAVFEL